MSAIPLSIPLLELPSLGLKLSSLIRAFPVPLLPGLVETLPPFFSGNGLVLAAPKKKTSHQKKRQRLLGPGSKHVQKKTNLNRCPSCGHVKRSHTICMNCFFEIRRLWKRADVEAELKPKNSEEAHIMSEIEKLDEKLIFPKKKESPLWQEIQKKEYLSHRPVTLPYERKSKLGSTRPTQIQEITEKK